MDRLAKNLMVFLLVPFFAAAAGEDPASFRYAASPKFLNAGEARDFANTLPPSARMRAQFVCEFAEGAPGPAWRVIREDFVSNMPTDAPQWKAQEGFSGIEDAVAFANANRAEAFFVACWNPNRNPASTSVTVFYMPDQLSGGEAYYVADGAFPTARQAADYANKSLPPRASASAQFVSEFFIARHLTSVWRIVALAANEGVVSPDSVSPWQWRAAEYDNEGHEFQLQSALDAANAADDAAMNRFAAAFRAADIASRVALFTLGRPIPAPSVSR